MTGPSGRVLSRPRCMGVRIGAALFGLLLDHVQEVVRERAVSRVFHAPPLLAGVMNLRGEVLPVLSPGLVLGGEHPAAGAEGQVVVVRELQGLRRRAGLRVTELAGLRELPEEGLAPVPELLPVPATGLLLGVIPSPPPCAVLDVTALFDLPELGPLRA